MVWTALKERNYEGVQFSELRQKIETQYTDLHDELSAAYYNKKPFREYGILTKEKFEALHSLIFEMLAVKFHEENLKLPSKSKIDEAEYRYGVDADGNQIDKVADAQQIIRAKQLDEIVLDLK